MSIIRALPIVGVLLGSSACFSPDTPSPADDESGSTTGDPGQSETAATTPSTSGNDEPTGPSTQTGGGGEGADTDDSGETASDSGETTSGSGCMPGVFGRSVFDGACFQ